MIKKEDLVIRYKINKIDINTGVKEVLASGLTPREVRVVLYLFKYCYVLETKDATAKDCIRAEAYQTTKGEYEDICIDLSNTLL